MPSFAQLTIVGHVGRVDDLKFTQSGAPILRFSLAVNTGFGERKTVSWYACSLFGKRAEKLAQYVTKGKALLVSGEPEINEYTSDSGVKRTSVQVRVDSVTFMGGKDDARTTEPKQESFCEDDGDVPF